MAGGTILGGALSSAFAACKTTDNSKVADAPVVPVVAPLPTLQGLPPQKSYRSVRVAGPYVSMTYDDGPQPVNTPELLDLLAKNDLKATFFMVGSNVQRYPDIVRRMVAEGHEVANHSFSHPALNQLSVADACSQISRTQEAIIKACGVTPTMMRPPYGAFNNNLTALMRSEFGLTTVYWSVDPNDWKKPGASVVAERILDGTRNGSIILSHDIHAATIKAMYTVLPGLKERGFKPITTSQLIAMELPSAPVG